MLETKINNLSRRVELYSNRSNVSLSEFAKSINESFQYLNDCNIAMENVVVNLVRQIKTILSNIELDKSHVLNIVRDKFNTHENIEELATELGQLNLKYKNLEIEDNVTFDIITRLNKLVAISLLKTDINLLSSDYNSLTGVDSSVENPGRRIILNSDKSLVMPDATSYNTFDVIYVDAKPISVIKSTKTNLKADYVVSEQSTVVFILFENKWHMVKS